MMAVKEFANVFNEIHPDFFEQDFIKERPADLYSEEMLLDLAGFDKNRYMIKVPENITFGFYQGDPEALKASVMQVEENWVQYFGGNARIFCAMAGNEVASFCLLDDFGAHNYTGKMLRFGGPGCVGTVPKFRRQGIGLKMVLEATQILKKEGYDLSYIHYTGVAPWYAKIGYNTVLKWNCNGFKVEEGD